MAKVVTRVWKSGPRKVRRTAWGYTLMRDGKQIRKYDASWSKEDAENALAAALLGQESAPALAEPVSRTLGQLVDEYLSYKRDRGKRSLRDDTCILRRRILPAFGAELQVRMLTGPMIAQYERDRIGKVSAYRVANELGVLRHMLRLGRKWGYLDQVPDVELPRKPEGRLRFLDENEIARLLAACASSHNPHLGPMVVLALNTGMRKDELQSLTWERVDLAADFGLSARLTLYRTKSGKPRGIPLNQDAVAALEAVEPAQERRAGLVFKRGEARTSWENALERAGIEGFRFHDLRHTFASHFMMRGGHLNDLKEILGHADIKMTQRYAHLSPHHLAASITKVEGLARAIPPAQRQHTVVESGVVAP